MATSIGISSDEQQDHLFGLTLTAVNGGGRTAPQAPRAARLQLVPQTDESDREPK